MGREIEREEWARLRAAQGRATPEDWRDTPILLAYQRQIPQETERHDVVIVEKSRRTGATWGAASDAVIRSGSSRQAGGMDTLYIGTSMDMAKEFVDAAAMWARMLDKVVASVDEMLFDDGSLDGIKALRIDFASGFSVVALSSRPRSLRGRQGFAILDEAAFADNLKELMKAALAFLIWGGKVLVISTHNGAANHFNELIQEARAGRKPYKVIRFDIDDALCDGLFERICLVNERRQGPWSPDKEAAWRENLIRQYGEGADEELFCIPSQGSGAWLPAPLIEARMAEVPVLRWAQVETFTYLSERTRRATTEDWIESVLVPVMRERLDPDLMSAFGGDIGRYRDLTVFWPLQIARNLKRVTPFVVELTRIPFQQQEQIRDAIIGALPRRLGGAIDAGGLGNQLAETATQKWGPSIVGVRFSTEWYRTEMPPLKAAFEDDMIEIPKDAETLQDLRAVKVVDGVATIPKVRITAQSGGLRHGDSAIALALAHYATRMRVEEYGYESARRGEADAFERRQRPLDDDRLVGGRRDGLW